MSRKNQLLKTGKTIRLRCDFCRSRISAGFGKSARLRPEPEPKTGTVLVTGTGPMCFYRHGHASRCAPLADQVTKSSPPIQLVHSQ